MTRPADRPPRARWRSGPVRRRWPIWGAASLLLHAALLWAFVPHETGAGAAGPPPELEIEMVQQTAETRGPATSARSQPEARPTPPVPKAPAGPGPPTAPQTPDARDAPRPATAPAAARPQARAAAPSEVNLDGGDENRDSLYVTGKNVVPPRPNARVHNEPPHYPAAAVRRHAQGLVVMVVHVTAAGVPAGVEITQSSGDVDIDDAARDAVALWRFQPARRDGTAVPFDYEMSLDFKLGTR